MLSPPLMSPTDPPPGPPTSHLSLTISVFAPVCPRASERMSQLSGGKTQAADQDWCDVQVSTSPLGPCYPDVIAFHCDENP